MIRACVGSDGVMNNDTIQIGATKAAGRYPRTDNVSGSPIAGLISSAHLSTFSKVQSGTIRREDRLGLREGNRYRSATRLDGQWPGRTA